ncbi:hypothetical protein DDB_G0290041 [Dictyostelium discoideum AX4]|uniref:Uncharacterized protein DDB_G0290041 n=1 Tax=Dictyostelium discoideum TaxID=44689 RepID=Y8705_DICDI|nr:hypothetical protein DDB_G0290041 [Dictyostelium discoideum AX4]Q54GM5.1 RecName: Full=Uncharacterized protein DDB_G0290041 [Dictyostelium discoideum]EAL62426.1 hypothetical protein DDB_G0290041 [Dictyostelium discoideum AX4]|eukprot:XP_635937.1 hypothetical protein DDB_G0290041 [Dictyostelium discoideum AX4]
MAIIKPGGHYIVPTKGEEISTFILENEGDELARCELNLNGNIQETLDILPHSTQTKMMDVRGKLTLCNIGKTHIKIL